MHRLHSIWPVAVVAAGLLLSAVWTAGLAYGLAHLVAKLLD